MTDSQQAYTDGPNTHKYHDAHFITNWTLVNLDDPDGVTHHFHVPTRIADLLRAEATAAAEQRLRSKVLALPAQPYTLSGLDTTTDSRMVNRAAVLALLDTPPPASPRQGEPVEVERHPVLMLFEGWADLLPVGTCWRIAEVRTHVEPSGVKGELGKAQSVIRFDPAPAALSEPAEAGEL